ncbi:MAG TPA: transposase [Gammaproteobacteria bacterium]|nr:transposase [Gammaproteobacteria bacterium]
MSPCIPRDALVEGYYQGLSTTQGRPSKDARLVIGAVVIKHKLCLSDEEAVAQIQENPYLQCFVGLADYQMEAPFAPSLFVEIRKQMGQSVFEIFQGAIIDAVEAEKARKKPPNPSQSAKCNDPPEDDPDDPSSASGGAAQAEEHRGKLILDATLPRRRSAIPRTWSCSKKRRCDDRMVSISQPYARPIVRGKQALPVEFSAKLSVSLNGDGVACVDHLRWDAFHEGGDLKGQVEVYRERHGDYPEGVLDDPVYGTQVNRRYLKRHGILFAGKPLGKPKKATEANQEELRRLKAQRREEYLQRIPIEGKNGYNLNYIRAKRADTSLAWINSIFLVMNLLILLRIYCALCKRGGAVIRMPLLQWVERRGRYPLVHDTQRRRCLHQMAVY